MSHSGTATLDLVEIMHDIRMQLMKQGSHSFRKLGLTFRDHDLNGLHTFDFFTFQSILQACSIFLKRQDLTKLYRYFDREQQERVSYHEFMQAVQGVLSARRYGIINLAFDRVQDNSNGGIVTIQSILQTFDPTRHPQVLGGTKKPQQVLYELEQAFQGAGELSGGQIVRDEFIDYYAGVSTCFPLDDDFFCAMMERAWHIREPREDARGTLISRIRQLLREKIRMKETGPRSESEKLRQVLKWFDLDNSGYVTYMQLCGAFQRFGLVLDDATTRALFDEFDHQGLQKINYAEFVAVIFEDDVVSTWYTRQHEERARQAAQNRNMARTTIEGPTMLVSSSLPKQSIAYNPSNVTTLPVINTADVPMASKLAATLPARSTAALNAKLPASLPTVVFVLGGPGCGKGTQCANLVREFDFVHLSAGDLLREERQRPGSKYGDLIERNIQAGKIVPVEITVNLIKTAIDQGFAKGKKLFLVDGFPRNQDNREGWERLMVGKVHVPFVLFFDCPEAEMERRILGRAQTSGRSDDNIAVARKRFDTFKNETIPVVQAFAASASNRSAAGVSNVTAVHVIDATPPPEIVYENVRRIFHSYQA